jgi:arsenate reductase
VHILFALAALGLTPIAQDAGPFVRLLWLVQEHGTSDAVNPANDSKLKARLAKAQGKDGIVTLEELGSFMKPETFEKLAGADGSIDASEAAKALEAATPESRSKLHSKLRTHAEYLTTTFDRIEPAHRAAAEKLAHWIAANDRPGQPLDVIVVCTGNSRRSILGSSMGNLAAAYYGMPEIRFHSGGTDPTAFNSRTVETLKSIGFEIEPTGQEAPRGEPETANPVHKITWGNGFETREFSKRFSDPSNPQNGFAAVMVCSEADEGCPFVKGAALRLSMPFLDPKTYDGGSFESAKYAERRDDIGRVMLAVILQARAEISSKSKKNP